MKLYIRENFAKFLNLHNSGERERGIMPDGIRLLLQNTLDTHDFTPANNQLGVPLSHPVHISELFTPNSLKPTKMDLKYTVKGLSKLLLFNAYAKAQTENFRDYVIAEAKKYPYPMKENLTTVREFLTELFFFK